MPIYLGLDIGTNSVGSAWVDTDKHEITLGVTVFPAGVDEKREPRGKKRREKRSLRRTIARKAARRRRLCSALLDAGLLPAPQAGDSANAQLMMSNPWQLRLAALTRPLTPHEFGRVLVHLNQRRGWAAGIEDDEDEDEKEDMGRIEEAVERTRLEMPKRDARTFGQLMAQLQQERTHAKHCDPIRNRRESYEWHADRQLVREEFGILCDKQRSFKESPLAPLLTEPLCSKIEDIIFFQRNTYWKTSSLRRCALEPTDRPCPKADMDAQRFLMLETVNRIRINGEPLDGPKRKTVTELLSTRPRVTVTELRKALDCRRGEINVEAEKKPEINCDWFSAAIVHGVFGPERWAALPDTAKESVNRAIQKFDKDDEAKLRRGAREWWGAGEDEAARLVAAWRERPSGDVRFSRKAIRNLLGRGGLEDGLSVTEARAKCNYPPHDYRLNKASRHYLRKHQHPEQLPPAPDLPNPVVRKAIHEVRRHVQAYLQKFVRKPDRIVVELARDARQPRKLRDALLEANRGRERERQDIIQNVLKPNGVDESQWPKAVDRIRLLRRQCGICPYSDLGTGKGQSISMAQAATGKDVEVDHIVPESRSFDNSLNNKLLCLRAANRNKGDQTPKEWLNDEQFHELEVRLKHFQKDHPRAWDNLHRDAPKMEEFVNSQLTDTGYITTHVVAYLRETLFPGKRQSVICTKGVYTAILRRGWGLTKEREDHRNHALDAVAIALTNPERLRELSRRAQAQERARAGLGYWPKPQELALPWEGFRDQVMELFRSRVVAHRPQLGLSGALHEDFILGKLPGYDDVFCRRVPAKQLTPPMLLDPKVDGKTLRVGKGGVVRDPALRKHIRSCLQANGIDAAAFTKKQIQDFAKAGKLTMPSGVPIRRIRVLRKIEDPVQIERNPEHPRFYIGGNNHHMEIVKDERTGKWRGRAVKMFDVARRIHPPNGRPELPAILGPKLEQLRAKGVLTDQDERFSQEDQQFYRGSKFHLSLCKGEMLRMKDPDTGNQSHFVVAKVNSDSVELVEHWDARPAEKNEKQPARRLIKKSAGGLQDLGAVKVSVNPFGQPAELQQKT